MLKLKCDGPLSNFAFIFNLRRYNKRAQLRELALINGRGLRSFTSQLNVSAFHGIGGARKGCVARFKGALGGV